MAIPPYVAVAVSEKRREWVARGAVASLIAVVAVVCVGLLVRERIAGSGEHGGSELAGQYYAVAKPPAFNFNRKLLDVPSWPGSLIKIARLEKTTQFVSPPKSAAVSQGYHGWPLQLAEP
jgi:hypothetical protein